MVSPPLTPEGPAGALNGGGIAPIRIDTSLSLGSTTWSRNAPPLPKISVSSDGYVSVPGTGDGLALKGYLAHGWFGTDRFTQNALLHEPLVCLASRSRLHEFEHRGDVST